MVDIPKLLDFNQKHIQADLEKDIISYSAKVGYEVAWKEHEKIAISSLKKIIPKYLPFLTEKNFMEIKIKLPKESEENEDSEDIEENPEIEIQDKADEGKNRIADLSILFEENSILISIKSARLKVKKGMVVQTGKPANDLGTFHSYEFKKTNFNASFEAWVLYIEKDSEKIIQNAFFNRSYFFVGRHSRSNGVGYREKDGNLRPKTFKMFFQEESYWKNLKEFERAFYRSLFYRAKQLVYKHFAFMTGVDKDIFFKRLINESKLENKSRLQMYRELRNIYSTTKKDKVVIYDDLFENFSDKI